MPPESSTLPAVSIVIPGHEAADLTTACLASIATHAGLPVDVIYVDNGSRPETVDAIHAHARAIGLPLTILRNEVNRGFTVATNQGIAASRLDVLLLNNDTLLGPGCLPALCRELETHPRAAAVGPLTGDHGVQSLRRDLVYKRAGLASPPANPLDPVACAALLSRRRSIPRRVLTGFCCLKRRAALDDIGHLDEHPDFANGLGTDDDWCARALAAGYEVRLCLDAFCAHLHHATFQRLSIDRKRQQGRAVRRLRMKAALRKTQGRAA